MELKQIKDNIIELPYEFNKVRPRLGTWGGTRPDEYLLLKRVTAKGPKSRIKIILAINIPHLNDLKSNILMDTERCFCAEYVIHIYHFTYDN